MIVAYAQGAGDRRTFGSRQTWRPLGQSVVVENRAGASGAIGTHSVTTAAPRRLHVVGGADGRNCSQPALAQRAQLRSGQGSDANCACGRGATSARCASQSAVFDNAGISLSALKARPKMTFCVSRHRYAGPFCG